MLSNEQKSHEVKYMNKHIDVCHTQCNGHTPIILLKIILFTTK